MDTNEKSIEEKVSVSQKDMDAIGEIANISFGSASTILSTLLNQTVNITTPHVEVVNLYDASDVELPHVVLEVSYIKGMEMENLLVLKTEVAAAIADLMMMGTGEVDPEKELTELELSAVKEAMNQMMGNAATSMSQLFNDMVDITPPNIRIVTLDNELESITNVTTEFVKISFDLQIGNLVHSKLAQIISVESAKKMVDKLLGVNDIGEENIITIEESEAILTEHETDILGEICNVSIGSASTIMSTLLNKQVRIGTPYIELVSTEEIDADTPTYLHLNIDFVKGISGSSVILLTKEVALIMCDLMMMGTGTDVETDKDLTDFELSAMQEMMNQMIGNAATAMSSMVGEVVDIAPPLCDITTTEEIVSQIYEKKDDNKIVQVTFDLEIEDVVQTKMLQFFLISEAKSLVNRMISSIDVASQETVQETAPKPAPQTSVEPESSKTIEVPQSKTLPVQGDDIDKLLHDVEVKLKFIFGSKTTTLEEFLAHEEHEIIEMIENIDEPIRIVVNGVIIGHGELVNVNGHFGVKILGMAPQ